MSMISFPKGNSPSEAYPTLIRHSRDPTAEDPVEERSRVGEILRSSPISRRAYLFSGWEL